MPYTAVHNNREHVQCHSSGLKQIRPPSASKCSICYNNIRVAEDAFT